jgi:hypothetical protein
MSNKTSKLTQKNLYQYSLLTGIGKKLKDLVNANKSQHYTSHLPLYSNCPDYCSNADFGKNKLADLEQCGVNVNRKKFYQKILLTNVSNKSVTSNCRVMDRKMIPVAVVRPT